MGILDAIYRRGRGIIHKDIGGSDFTKVHRSLLRFSQNNYGIIFVHGCPYVKAVFFLTVMLDMCRSGYVWYVMGVTAAC